MSRSCFWWCCFSSEGPVRAFTEPSASALTWEASGIAYSRCSAMKAALSALALSYILETMEHVSLNSTVHTHIHTSLKKRILTSVCKRNVVTGSRLKDEVWRGKCFGLNFPPSRSDLIKAIKFIWISATQLYNGDNYISIKNFKLCITWRLAHNKPSHAWK